MKISTVDEYFSAGCGRCSRFDTPECKVQKWQAEIQLLRSIVNACGLQEELKWSHPVYTHQGKNIVMIGAFNDNCVLSFLKGALLQDAHGILTMPGENSQSAKVVRFTQLGQIQGLEQVLKDYIFEAVEVEKSGLKASFKKADEHDIPEEFQQRMEQHAALESAFKSLTPGRQRAYLMHFSAAKQSSTRVSRIEKCIPMILAGKGLND